jgi:hypothetical protein
MSGGGVSDPERFHAALARFDEAHAGDPNRETFDGREIPRELLYAQRMSTWLERLTADDPPSEALRLAARCQHLCRWKIDRRDYPMNRQGYLAWRRACQQMHAELATEILRQVGYDEETIARVGDLLQKKRLKLDPESQLLEDVVCLVFLESYLAPFSAQQDEERLVNILRRTWKKMSPRGQRAALELDLPAESRGLIQRALEEPGSGSGVTV